MKKVINDIVKMDWDAKGWLQTSAKNGKGTFIFASKDYESTKLPKITVFFTARTAFVIDASQGSEEPTEENMWSADELIPVIKRDGVEGDFPICLDEYVPVIESGDFDCDDWALEHYGIEAHKKDIEARLTDVAPYGDEHDLPLT